MNRLRIVVAATTAIGLISLAQPGEAKSRAKAEKLREQEAAEIRATNYKPGTGWEGYFEDKDGRVKQLTEPINQHPDELWTGLRFTAYRGLKPRIAVYQIANRSPQAEASGSGGNGTMVPVSGLEEMFHTALIRTNRFAVVPRKRLNEVLLEQDLGKTDRVTMLSAAKTGQLLGAQYILTGTVLSWTAEKMGSGIKGVVGKATGGFFSGIGLGKTDAEVSIQFEVVDSSTSEALFSEIITATVSNAGYSVDEDEIEEGETTKAVTPLQNAARAAINKGIYLITRELEDKPWSGAVAGLDGSKVVISGGSDQGLEPGMKLTVLSSGKDVIDPSTGLSLGSLETSIGTLEILAVQEKLATAAITDGCAGIKPKDRVRLAQPAAAAASATSASTSTGSR